MIVKETNRIDPTRSIFSMFGKNEPTATASLAYVLARFPEVLNRVVHLVIPRVRIDVESVEIHKERHEKSSGRTDIEIVGGNLHVIFEGKLGSGIPSYDQVAQYVQSRLSGSQRYKRLVFLVNNRRQASDSIAEYQVKDPSLKGLLATLTWADVQSAVTQSMKKDSSTHQFLLYEFWNYLKTEVKMKSFEEEVMIVGINDHFKYDKNAYPAVVGMTSAQAAFKKQLYEGGNRLKPVLYLAFKYQGKLKHFARVQKQELVNKSMVFHLEQLLELPVERAVPFAFRQGMQYSSFQKLLNPELKEFRSIIERETWE
jgi:hypothetical protein